MIAIPIDSKDSNTISQYFGNANFFALVDSKSGDVSFCQNRGSGNGIETANFLDDLNVTSTIFYHMGDGVFKTLDKKNIKVYTCEKQNLTIDEIYKKFSNNNTKLVTKNNCNLLLDSGNSSACTCGCSKK
ncbi:NifB/NifX family molybdenum-iron cluster-binding protein [Arcobacter sp. CECT 8985]|uniref:NifB/NifX family molybdenum-iron cluster-binding protein n=1 Tax=Arcobacter sp. CECT 8985 TaxID=1935424 RepID=UPI00100B3521|nr:NifB/NifX family molybdenum-iron cluster-binding protein [Arcobacter sp. CECT 8985]RXJ87848.1 dinitrogenase iron-molybdenum cofactor biosynthesis protein [Arcobacter sp. CECT 8985]